MLTIRRITTTEEFETLSVAWNDLLKKSEIRSVFLTWEWLYTWWEHFSARGELRLITVWREDKLAAIAPLMLLRKRKWGLNLKLLANIAYTSTDISGFIVAQGDDEAALKLCEAISQSRDEWQVFEMAEASLGNSCCMQHTGCFPSSEFSIRNEKSVHLFIPFEKDWETFYNSQSKNLKQDHKRKFARLKKEGVNLQYRIYGGKDIQPKHLQEIYKINEFGNFPDTYRSPTAKKFHQKLVERMQEAGYLELSFLNLDGVPVAFRYGFIFDNHYEDWRLGYDSRYAAYSPGTLLLFFTAQDKLERGLKGIDLLRGLEEYKRRWKVQEINYSHLYIIHRADWFTRLVLIFTPAWKQKVVNFFQRRFAKLTS